MASFRFPMFFPMYKSPSYIHGHPTKQNNYISKEKQNKSSWMWMKTGVKCCTTVFVNGDEGGPGSQWWVLKDGKLLLHVNRRWVCSSLHCANQQWEPFLQPTRWICSSYKLYYVETAGMWWIDQIRWELELTLISSHGDSFMFFVFFLLHFSCSEQCWEMLVCCGGWAEIT